MASRLLSLALAALALADAAATFAQGRSTYCCNDDRGQQVCGDTLPQACFGRAYREINERGMTTRRVAPPLTPEQIAQKEAEAQRRKEEERLRREEERRNQALLQSYASEKDIDYLRDKAIADIEESIARAQERYDEALRRKRQLDEEMEFYRKTPPPKALADEVRDTDSILRAHSSVIESKRRDMEAVRAKYEDEKRRYQEIIRNRPAGAR